MLVRVPGNLLLFGEYAVTLPGGKGIALAMDTWVELTAENSSTMGFCCNYGNTKHDKVYNPPLIDCVLEQVAQVVTLPPLKICIDSSSFYYSDGKKKGYGSSAAVTAGLTYLLLHQAYGRAPDIDEEVYPLALAIHRKFQGGKGSGYDIAASLFGGIGLFTGGKLPTWQPLSLPWIHQLYIMRGKEEASTHNALTLFYAFKGSHPEEVTRFVAASNKLFQIEDPEELFQQGAALNQWIHGKLGMPSFDLPLPFSKPLGAGAEIFALYSKDNLENPLHIASKGLQCLP